MKSWMMSTTRSTICASSSRKPRSGRRICCTRTCGWRSVSVLTTAPIPEATIQCTAARPPLSPGPAPGPRLRGRNGLRGTAAPRSVAVTAGLRLQRPPSSPLATKKPFPRRKKAAPRKTSDRVNKLSVANNCLLLFVFSVDFK